LKSKFFAALLIMLECPS